MTNSNTNFDSDFNDLFDPNKSKEARKNFKCRLKTLYTLYPNIFVKGFASISNSISNSNNNNNNNNKNKNKNLGIRLSSNDSDTVNIAKNLLRQFYIGDISENKISTYHTTQKYVSKVSGEVKTYNYSTKYVKTRKDKFDILRDNQDIIDIIKMDIPTSDKVLKIQDYLMKYKIENNFTYNQLYGFVYRFS